MKSTLTTNTLSKLIFSGLLCLLTSGIVGQIKTQYNDGPYIDRLGDSILIRWVEAGIGHDTSLLASTATTFDKPNLPKVDLTRLNFTTDLNWEYDFIDKFAVVSDLHGYFDTLLKLLRAQGVVDNMGAWAFGDNHLVIAGDHFDRGDKVMEILWYLFKLEQEATAAGGKVHILLGNHEAMVLNSDLRYLNVKYAYTSAVFKRKYDELFTKNSILGNWLRSKNIVITINENLIVHGGMSQAVVDANLSCEAINAYFRDSILVASGKEMADSEMISLLTGDEGPLWYRGQTDSITYHKDSLEQVLNFYNVNSVIIGHTYTPNIRSRYDGKLFMIDCGITRGLEGEVLVVKKDKYYSGKRDGSLNELNGTPRKQKKSLFTTLYEANSKEANIKLKLTTDFKKLTRNKLKEEEQEATVEFLTASGDMIIAADIKLRARGNMRKQVCTLPPIKFNFSRKELSKLGYKSADKLKMVLVCRESNYDQEKLYKEYFLYGLYQIISPNGVRAKLIDVEVYDKKDNKKKDFTGFIVEDEDAFAMRHDARILGGNSVINSTVLHRESFVNMYLFQYMIANTDWSIGHKHNMILAKMPQLDKLIPLPYDFDYSGFVGQSYAIPSPELPIRNVNQRYFLPYVVTEEEFDQAALAFQNIKQKLLDHCDKATYMSDKTLKSIKNYILDFYEELDRPDKMKKNLKTKE